MSQSIEPIDSTRRLILQGAAVFCACGACGHPLRPDACSRRGQRQIFRRMRSSRRAATTRSRRCTARPPSFDKVKLDAPEIEVTSAT